MGYPLDAAAFPTSNEGRWPVIIQWLFTWRAKKYPPREGQVWLQDGSPLYIGRRVAPDRFVISTSSLPFSGASWGETDAEWQNRIRNRLLRLVEDVPSLETGAGT